MATNWKQLKAIEYKNKQRILKLCPDVPETSGIYIFFREESGFKYAYIGQAKHLLTRLAQHLKGYQHIDLSLKKHGLYSSENPNGWEVAFVRLPLEDLDGAEQRFIQRYANAGYQLRNKTAGGQGEGKFEIAETRPRKTYQEGVKQGYEKARKEVAGLFNARIHEVETQSEMEKALKETIVRVKQNSIEFRESHANPSDINAMMQFIKERKELQQLEKLHISIN